MKQQKGTALAATGTLSASLMQPLLGLKISVQKVEALQYWRFTWEIKGLAAESKEEVESGYKKRKYKNIKN